MWWVTDRLLVRIRMTMTCGNLWMDSLLVLSVRFLHLSHIWTHTHTHTQIHTVYIKPLDSGLVNVLAVSLTHYYTRTYMRTHTHKHTNNGRMPSGLQRFSKTPAWGGSGFGNCQRPPRDNLPLPPPERVFSCISNNPCQFWHTYGGVLFVELLLLGEEVQALLQGDSPGRAPLGDGQRQVTEDVERGGVVRAHGAV